MVECGEGGELAEPTSYLADGVRGGVCSGLAEPTSYVADGVSGGVL